MDDGNRSTRWGLIQPLSHVDDVLEHLWPVRPLIQYDPGVHPIPSVKIAWIRSSSQPGSTVEIGSLHNATITPGNYRTMQLQPAKLRQRAQ